MRFLAILAMVFAITPAFAAGTGKDDNKSESYALVTGTVFRDTGLALPGAEVILAPAAEPGGRRGKAKKRTAASDRRGEFAFRLPAGQAAYTLTVRAKGYAEQSKPVATTGEDRIDVYFRLDPTSN